MCVTQQLSAIEALLHAATHDKAMSVRRVALFSAGTIFLHPRGRQNLSTTTQEYMEAIRSQDPSVESDDAYVAYHKRLLRNFDAVDSAT